MKIKPFIFMVYFFALIIIISSVVVESKAKDGSNVEEGNGSGNGEENENDSEDESYVSQSWSDWIFVISDWFTGRTHGSGNGHHENNGGRPIRKGGWWRRRVH
uniref:Glycine-rich protein n=1 Tax=Ononis spinosa TaxID=58890 RepID=A0A411AFH8_ONOSP|nr:glycine-rich protein [Ononis spinosa]